MPIAHAATQSNSTQTFDFLTRVNKSWLNIALWNVEIRGGLPFQLEVIRLGQTEEKGNQSC
jgi:hypothetical protein